MANDDDDTQNLIRAVEIAAHQFQVSATELRTIADDLPRKARKHAGRLRLAADRLDGVAELLGLEVMRVPDPGFVAGLINTARKAAAPVTIVAGLLATGAIEEAASQLVPEDFGERITSVWHNVTDAADAADATVTDTEPSPTDDDESEPDDATTTNEGFSGTQAAKVVGITYRQLDYWARTDLFRPSLSGASGTGARRRYSYTDLLELRLISNILEAGMKLEQVRAIVDRLRALPVQFTNDTYVIVDGSNVTLAQGDDAFNELKDASRVANVIPLGSIKDQVDAQLIPLDEASDEQP